EKGTTNQKEKSVETKMTETSPISMDEDVEMMDVEFPQVASSGETPRDSPGRSSDRTKSRIDDDVTGIFSVAAGEISINAVEAEASHLSGASAGQATSNYDGKDPSVRTRTNRNNKAIPGVYPLENELKNIPEIQTGTNFHLNKLIVETR